MVFSDNGVSFLDLCGKVICLSLVCVCILTSPLGLSDFWLSLCLNLVFGYIIVVWLCIYVTKLELVEVEL